MIKRNKTIAKIMILAVCANVIPCASVLAANKTETTNTEVSDSVQTVQSGYYKFDPSTGDILEYNKYSFNEYEDNYFEFNASTGTISHFNIVNNSKVVVPDNVLGITVTSLGNDAFFIIIPLNLLQKWIYQIQ